MDAISAKPVRADTSSIEPHLHPGLVMGIDGVTMTWTKADASLLRISRQKTA
jgi:hypothetical protein